jgi:mRNA-degrading endonuclease RelE of RelBE toxin-antitoxin system
MSHRILVRPEARTALLALPTPTRRQLQHAIDSLADHPQPTDAVALTGHPNTLRIHTADHHIVYTVHEGEILILVIDKHPDAMTQ